MRGLNKGDKVRVKVLRSDSQKEFRVIASHFPRNLAPKLARRLLGVEVVDISEKNCFKALITADAGVIISEMDSGSVLGKIGAGPGDVIRKIDEMKIDDIESFYDAVIKYRWKNSVVVLIQRENRGYYITVNLKGT